LGFTGKERRNRSKSGWICAPALVHGSRGEEGDDCERRIRGGVLQWKQTRDVFGGGDPGQGKRGFSFFFSLFFYADGGRWEEAATPRMPVRCRRPVK